MPTALQSIALFSFIALSFFAYGHNLKTELLKKRKLVLYGVASLFYWFLLLSSFWTSDTDRLIKEIQPTLLLAIMPFVIIFLTPRLKEQNLKVVLYTFVVGLIIYFAFWFSFYVEGISIYQEIVAKESPLRDESIIYQLEYIIGNDYRTEIGGLGLRGQEIVGNTSFFSHSTYVSTYYLLGILSCLRLLSASSALLKVVQVLIIILFSLFVFYLSSKIALVLLALTFLITTFAISKVQIKAFVFLLVSIVVILNFQKIKNKTNTILSYNLVERNETGLDNSAILDLKRVHIYDCAMQSIGDFALIGLGFGDVQQTINDCLMKKHIGKYDIQLNAHSQYLHYFMAAGFVAVILFIFSLIYFLIIFARSRNLFGVMIVLVFMNVTLFESFISRVYGVIPYVLFIGLALRIYLGSLEIKNDNQEG